MSNQLVKIIPKDVFVDYEIKQKIKRAEKIAYDNAPQALKKGAVNYSTTAAKVMPPPKKGSRSMKIDDSLYWRKIYSIVSLLKNPQKIRKIFDKDKFDKYIKQFKYNLQQGNYFVVKAYKDKGKHQTAYYAKSRHIAKKNYGRIKYRGLYKWLWGANLNQIGEKTPSAFRKLLAKSPDMVKVKDLAKMKLEKNQKSVIIVSEYYADGIDYFVTKAESKANKSACNKIKTIIKKKIKEDIKNV